MKRFIFIQFYRLVCLLVLGMCLNLVKPSFATDFYDRILEIPNPQNIVLDKTGPVVLAGIMREETLDLNEYLQINQRVRIRVVSETPDRQGRKIVDLYDPDGSWINAQIVRDGKARVYPDHKSKERVRDLYIQEDLARLSENGYWPDGTFQVHDALNEDIPTDGFSIIEGLVVDVAILNDKTYFNFGSNWREDFTILLEKKNSFFFREFGWEPSILKGKRIQIRGWVIDQNGPMVKMDHPLQLQLMK